MIRIFAAGNFVLMNSEKLEQKFIREVTKRTCSCNRLASFFFKKELENVMKIKKGIADENKSTT